MREYLCKASYDGFTAELLTCGAVSMSHAYAMLDDYLATEYAMSIESAQSVDITRVTCND